MRLGERQGKMRCFHWMLLATTMLLPIRQDCGCGGCPVDNTDPSSGVPGPQRERVRTDGDYRRLQLASYRSPSVPAERVHAIMTISRRFFQDIWGIYGEVNYSKHGFNNFSFDTLGHTCGLLLDWGAWGVATLTIPSGGSSDVVTVYQLNPAGSGYAPNSWQITNEASSVLQINGIVSVTPSVLFFPVLLKRLSDGTYQSLNGVALGPSLDPGNGEGSIWLRTTPISTLEQDFIELAGITHEAMHLVGRVTHGYSAVVFGDQPDTAWGGLFSPAGQLFSSLQSWNGYEFPDAGMVGGISVTADLADKYMVVSSIRFGMSQCAAMRSDPRNYLLAAN